MTTATLPQTRSVETAQEAVHAAEQKFLTLQKNLAPKIEKFHAQFDANIIEIIQGLRNLEERNTRIENSWAYGHCFDSIKHSPGQAYFWVQDQCERIFLSEELEKLLQFLQDNHTEHKMFRHDKNPRGQWKDSDRNGDLFVKWLEDNLFKGYFDLDWKLSRQMTPEQEAFVTAVVALRQNLLPLWKEANYLANLMDEVHDMIDARTELGLAKQDLKNELAIQRQKAVEAENRARIEETVRNNRERFGLKL